MFRIFGPDFFFIPTNTIACYLAIKVKYALIVEVYSISYS